MKRTVVHFLDTSTYGGCEEAVLHLLRELDRTLWCPYLFHYDEPGIERLRSQLLQLDIPCRIVPRISSRNIAVTLPKFVREVRAVNPAIFHAHLNWPLACWKGLVAARLAQVPSVVATAHLYSPITEARFARWKQRLHSASVDRYIAVSDEVRTRLCRELRVSPDKVCVVHNGVGLRSSSEAPDPEVRAALTGGADRPIVFTPARLHSQKGHIYLLRAAALVPDAIFVLAGEGPERDALERCARELGIEERVRFLGQRRDIPTLLAACDLVVLPSLYEGLPLSVLEAMAVGKPVVATAIGGTREAVIHGETGILIPPENSEDLASAVRCLLADPGLATRLSLAGKARVAEFFSAEVMARNTCRVYDTLLSERPERLSECSGNSGSARLEDCG